ncbi:MAG: extracellular solute-binding protein [Inhella sp.]
MNKHRSAYAARSRRGEVMITVGRGRRILKLAGAATAAVTVLAVAGCSAGDSGTDSGDGGDVTIEFAQWWEPELPDGEFRALIDEFEDANPGITVELVSGPYASTKEQLFAGAASGTMPDVVGLDGAWVNDFASQGVISDLSALMEEYDYDDSELASQIQVDGSTYMIPVVNFVYPMFTNDSLLAEAGVTAPPTTRTEFADAASKVSALGGDVSGWVLPLSLEAPNGVQNDVMSWVWASGGSMLKDGQPDLTNDDVTSAVDFIGGMWDDGSIASGSFTMKEQDKVLTTLERLRLLGVGLAIDDFGTGYSSFSYLRKLHASTLKIDKSFIHDAAQADEALAIVRAMVQMAGAMGLSTLAEGVETEAQRDMLLDSGCQSAQGYWFARPQAPEEIAKLLSLGQLPTPTTHPELP